MLRIFRHYVGIEAGNLVFIMENFYFFNYPGSLSWSCPLLSWMAYLHKNNMLGQA